MKIVECVPNFSEGRNRAVIDAIAEAIQSAEGVEMLDVDPGRDTNRTVITFIGAPEAVLEGAFRGIARAAETIDMGKHHGAHARMGACDVCPFVPVREVTMEECVELARSLGRRVADQLGIPVYLYEEAASSPARQNLAEVRKGEYEGLADKLKDPVWKPDFGEAKFNPRSGASIIGAREFLIAYNFNLNTCDQKIAHDIALSIREAGRPAKNEKGEILKDRNGKTVHQPGKFKCVKAVGWYMENFHCAQISMNLTNYKVSPLASIFDEVCALAVERGVRCTGCELVGLIPQAALLEVGRHFLRKAGKSAGVPEKELVRLAVQSLGLNELYPFDANKKIIEYRLKENRPLAAKSLTDFVDETSSDSPAPGGGSVSALCGALGAALSCMVAQLTVGKKGYERVQEPMKTLAEEAQPLKDFMLRAIDDDTAAFNSLMEAMKLPKGTPEQKAERAKAMEQATLRAITVPLSVLNHCGQSIDLALRAARDGNQNSLSDAGVAGLCARTAAEGAYYNVMINLASLSDRAAAGKLATEAKVTLAEVRTRAGDLAGLVESKLSEKQE